jgi:mRNA interferase RelE/StbE
MSSYTVVLTKSAEKELHKLPLTVIEKVIAAIGTLANEPRPVGCKKLKGFKNLYRIRIGNYRVIYAIEDVILLVEVRAIGDRKDIYD